jgi:DNA-binding transcriptional ArsR family regulator
LLPDPKPNRTQLWAMAHPLRYRILELLAEGPSTASELARRLHESRGSTSYHLRMLARAGAVVEDPDRGTKRERWWRRPESPQLLPTDADVEGRAISARMLSMIFARDDEARRRFITHDVEAAWHEHAYAGNWVVELSPEEADELGQQLASIVMALRRRRDASANAVPVLVSVSALPWLE